MKIRILGYQFHTDLKYLLKKYAYIKILQKKHCDF